MELLHLSRCVCVRACMCVCVCVCAIVILHSVQESNLRHFIYPVQKYNRSEIISKLEQDWGKGSVKLLS